MIVNCLNCNIEFDVYPSVLKYGRGKFCSLSCRSTGKFNSHWKGGMRIREKGYIQIWNPKHPNADSEGYVYEHRLVMENYIGRNLTKNEVVHHKNKITSDNRIINLELFHNDSEHRNKTIRGKDNPNYRHGRNVVVV